MYLFGPAVCNWILCSTKQNLFHFSFLFFFLSFSHRNALQRKKLRDIPFLPSFLKLNYRGEKKKISDFSNDDRPRLFLFELLFFSRKKRRRSWRIKNKARLKKISCVSLMRKLRDAFTNEIHPPLRTGRNFGRSHDTFECNHEYSQRRVNIGRGGRNSLLRLWSHEREEERKPRVFLP